MNDKESFKFRATPLKDGSYCAWSNDMKVIFKEKG